jgi:hypothetical protein
MAQVVEHFPNNSEILSSIFNSKEKSFFKFKKNNLFIK